MFDSKEEIVVLNGMGLTSKSTTPEYRLVDHGITIRYIRVSILILQCLLFH